MLAQTQTSNSSVYFVDFPKTSDYIFSQSIGENPKMSFGNKLTALIGVCVLCMTLACQPKRLAAPPASAIDRSAFPPQINSFIAKPTLVRLGQDSELIWATTGTNRVELQGCGPVDPQGRRKISPASTVTYVLLASNAFGETSASLTVIVTRPSPVVAKALAAQSLQLPKGLLDVHFDSLGRILEEDRKSLDTDAALLRDFLKSNPDPFQVLLEGHADQLHSSEFNLALGHRGALLVQQAFADLGVAPERLQIVSFGSERPACGELTETCAALNRRVHISPGF